MKKIHKVSAPGKLILSGEHAVVYGFPAIVTAVNRRLTVGKSGDIKSDIPVGSGMGSSAALAVATSALKLGKFDLEKINEMAYKMEKKRHGNPSGVDNTVCTYGGLLWYRKEGESFKIFRKIIPKRKFPRLYVLNSGKPAESTREMVEIVAEKVSNRGAYFNKLFKEIELITRGFLNHLTGVSDEPFFDLLKENEVLLEKLEIVSGSTKRLIRQVEKIGGCAKVSGAGGIKSGSGILIAYHKDPEKFLHFVKAAGIEAFPIKTGEEGVRIERD